jgi:hypothetical protein
MSIKQYGFTTNKKEPANQSGAMAAENQPLALPRSFPLHLPEKWKTKPKKSSGKLPPAGLLTCRFLTSPGREKSLASRLYKILPVSCSLPTLNRFIFRISYPAAY